MEQKKSDGNEARKSSIMIEQESEKLIQDIRQKFLQLPFDTKISLVNWCKEFLNNERKGSVPFNYEDEYLNSIARKQTIIQSVVHIAPLLPWFVIVAITVSTIASSLMIPFFKMIVCDSPFLASGWRAMINVLFGLPFMIRELRLYKDSVGKLFSVKNILTILLCQVFGVLQGLCQ